jgi:hypothetical protein
VAVLLLACLVLVGVGYYLLRLMSGVLTVDRAKVEERLGRGELLFPGEGQGLRGLSLSSASPLVAFIVSGGEGDFLLVREGVPGGREVARLPCGEDTLICWASHPERLVYGDSSGLFLGRVAEDGGLRVSRMTGPGGVAFPSCSPDGRWVAWADFSLDPPLYRWASLEGGGGGSIPYGLGEPLWFPDGGAFLHRGGPGEMARALYRVDPVSGLEERWWELDRDPLFLWFSREGRLFYLSRSEDWGYAGGLMVAEARPDKGDEKVLLASGSYPSEDPVLAVDPEGKRVALLGREGLEILDLEAGVLYRYPEVTGVKEAAFHSRGGYLFYLDEQGIWRMEI